MPIGESYQHSVTGGLLRRQRLRGVSWFLETGGGPPKGITMLGRWHAPKSNRGFCLGEREDAKGIYECVSDVGVLERRLFQMMPDTRLNEIVRQLQLSSEHWTVEVTPLPSLEAPAARSLRDR